jgi:hypothetical protein
MENGALTGTFGIGAKHGISKFAHRLVPLLFGGTRVQGWREPVILKSLEDRAAATGRYDAALRELMVSIAR